jgi:hypothetical protein
MMAGSLQIDQNLLVCVLFLAVTIPVIAETNAGQPAVRFEQAKRSLAQGELGQAL